MIQIWSCDITQIDPYFFEKELSTLPHTMQNEIGRYRNPTDKKLRIAARSMLRLFLKQSNLPFSIHDWQMDSNKKPFIPQCPNFNISHSHHLSIIAMASMPIGIDIEKIVPINTQNLSPFLHTEEEKWIQSSSSELCSFYTIWVKKEAALKAIGTGLLGGLREFSCVTDFISHNNKQWHFFPIRMHKEYCCYICTPKKIQIKDIELISVNQLLQMAHN